VITGEDTATVKRKALLQDPVIHDHSESPTNIENVVYLLVAGAELTLEVMEGLNLARTALGLGGIKWKDDLQTLDNCIRELHVFPVNPYLN
jgi:hypothetical protein